MLLPPNTGYWLTRAALICLISTFAALFALGVLSPAGLALAGSAGAGGALKGFLDAFQGGGGMSNDDDQAGTATAFLVNFYASTSVTGQFIYVCVYDYAGSRLERYTTTMCPTSVRVR